MSNFIDVLTESGFRTGEILSRSEIHRLGKPHRAVHLYLLNSNDELLLQRRALTVDHAPGFLSISVTAHVNAGETSGAAVRREMEEELGIDATGLRMEFLFSAYQEVTLSETYIDRQFNDVYLTRVDVQPDLIPVDPSEVSEVIFVPLEQFQRMAADPSSGLAAVYAREWQDVVYFLGGLPKYDVPKGMLLRP